MGPNYATMAYDKALKKTGLVSTGLLDSFTIDLFNSPLLADAGIEIMRLFGPNMHAISYAYALCFFAIFALYRGRIAISVLLVALLFLANAKGPIILFLLVGASWATFKIFGARFAFACHCLALIAYAALGIVLGLSIGDYHVIGLMGGLHEFLANPIGLGIGAGGNLSSEFVNINWEDAQAAGRTPFAVESAVGVLLYQTGIFAVAIIGAYCLDRVARPADRPGDRQQPACRRLVRPDDDSRHRAVSGRGLFRASGARPVHGAGRHDHRGERPHGAPARTMTAKIIS